MAVYKDNATGTWRVIYRFTNWKGERKQTQKRGFATKREAQAWEHEVMLKQNSKLDMTFASFFELYEADKKQRVKCTSFFTQITNNQRSIRGGDSWESKKKLRKIRNINMRLQEKNCVLELGQSVKMRFVI